VGDSARALGIEGEQRSPIRRPQEIEGQQDVGAAPAHAGAARNRLAAHDAVRDHLAPALGESGLVHVDRVEPVDLGGANEQGVHRDDAGAADAHQEDLVAVSPGGRLRFGQGIGEPALEARGRCARARHAQEGGAVAIETGAVVAARRRVNARLAAERRRDGAKRDARGPEPAIPAALADVLVDHGLALRRRQQPAALEALLVIGADLVVDEGRHPGLRADLAHGPLPLRARDAADPLVRGRQPQQGGVVAHRHHPAHTVRQQLAHEVGDGLGARGPLAAGHRDHAVVEELERDLHAGGDARAHGQSPRVEVGAVPEVLEQVIRIRVGLEADPVGALGAHRAHVLDAAVHEQGHRVAADPAPDRCAFGGSGGGRVGTAAAEVRNAGGARRRAGALASGAQRLGAAFELGPPEPRRQVGCEVQGEASGAQLAASRDPRLAVGSALPDHERVIDVVVEGHPDLLLEVAAARVDDDDLVQSVCELAQAPRLEGMQQLDLQESQAEALERGGVQTQQGERRLELPVQGPRGDQPDGVARVSDADGIQAVGVGVAAHGFEPRVDEVLLDLDHPRRQQPRVEARAEAASHHLELGTRHAGKLLGQIEHQPRVGHVGHDLDADPDAGVAGELDRMAPEAQHLGRVGRGEQRGERVGEGVLAVAGQGRALAVGIVADEGERAAEAGAAHEVRVAERVEGAVEARGLAEPEAEHPIDFGVGKDLEHLGAGDGAGGDLLVERRREANALRLEQGAKVSKRRVEPGERRARVAGEQGAEPAAIAGIPVDLVQRQPHERLQAGQVYASVRAHVTLPERAGGRHGGCIGGPVGSPEPAIPRGAVRPVRNASREPPGGATRG
jgi:hypothetical protein